MCFDINNNNERTNHNKSILLCKVNQILNRLNTGTKCIMEYKKKWIISTNKPEYKKKLQQKKREFSLKGKINK